MVQIKINCNDICFIVCLQSINDYSDLDTFQVHASSINTSIDTILTIQDQSQHNITFIYHCRLSRNIQIMRSNSNWNEDVDCQNNDSQWVDDVWFIYWIVTVVWCHDSWSTLITSFNFQSTTKKSLCTHDSTPSSLAQIRGVLLVRGRLSLKFNGQLYFDQFNEARR